MAKLAINTCVLLAVSLLAFVSTGWSKEPSCHRCGCREVVRECRLVTTTKFVTTNYWDSATQSFCIPHIKGMWPARPGHADSDKGEAEKSAKADEDALCHDAASQYGAVPRNRNRLVRKKCVSQVPVIGWVTHYVCCQCGQKIDGGDQPAKNEPSAGKQALELHPTPAIPMPPSMPQSSRRQPEIDISDP